MASHTRPHARSPYPPGVPLPGEQSRALEPHTTGVVERAGGRVAWEAYGSGEPAIVFVPPWQIVHSRIWKAQVPDFARRHLVVTWDARGNGRSDRPLDPEAHGARARADDLAAVMDAAAIRAAVLVGLSGAARPTVILAAEHPERVLGLYLVSPATPLGEPGPGAEVPFDQPAPNDDGWNKETLHYWRRDFPGYLEHFFAEAFPEPHSSKQREDGVAYGLATDPESLAATLRAPGLDVATYRVLCAAVRCPTLIVQGTDDRIAHVTQGEGLAAAIPGARIVLAEGSGHVLNARDPVRVNLLLREFLRGLEARR